MKNVWAGLFTVLVSQQAAAINIDVPGYSFAGIADTQKGSAGEFTTNWATPEESITDALAATYVFSWGTFGTNAAGDTGIVDTTAYKDLSFGSNVFDGVGIDLSIFVVGAGSQSIDLTLFDSLANTSSSTRTYTNVTYTGFNVDVNGLPAQEGVPDPDYGIYVMDIDLADFGFLGANPIDIIRLGVDYGSASPSLIGAYNSVPVPVPAAVWLFGSGLVGLAGIARKKRA